MINDFFRNQNRFTFDHIPFIGSSTNSTPATASTGPPGLSPGGMLSIFSMDFSHPKIYENLEKKSVFKHI